MHLKQSYAHLCSVLHGALDHSAIFLTVLAGRTVKKAPSPKGPGFESRRRRQKGHRSIANYTMKALSSHKLIQCA